MLMLTLLIVSLLFAPPETYQKEIGPAMAPAPDSEPEPAVKG